MSNGVEVIVAGDKTTLPGEPNLRILLRPTSSIAAGPPSPSTLTGDHMQMLMPSLPDDPSSSVQGSELDVSI